MRTKFAPKSSGLATLHYVDATIECILYALLAFMPFAFGVVAPWSETIVVAGATAIALALIVRGILNPAKPAWTWAYIPVLLFILIAIAQIIPLPARLLSFVSPHTLSLKSSLLTNVPGAADALKHPTLSFYPLATRHDLTIIFVATVVFIAVLNVFRHPTRAKRLFITISVIGAAVALLALLQNLTGTDEIYWMFRTPKGARSGPFVNYSHYTQFMNLSIGAVLSLLLTLVAKENTNKRRNPDALYKAALLAAVVIGIATILLSMSRGGVVAMLAGFLLLALLLLRRGMNRTFGWAIGLSAFAALAVVIAVGFDPFYDKMATFHSSADPSSGRMQIYKDILTAWRQFPVVGMGLGVHKMTYPMFDGSTNPLTLEYADSDYFQLIEEMGAIGLLLVLAFAAIIWTSVVRCIKSDSPARRLAAAGLSYGLLAVMVQSMTDYGQHLPSIACLTAITCAMLINLAQAGRKSSELATLPRVSTIPWRVGRLILPTGLAALLTFALVFINNTRVTAASTSRAADIVASLDRSAMPATTAPSATAPSSDAAYSQILDEADDAVAHSPRDVEARYWQCWYRWKFVSRHVNPKTGMILLTDDDLAQVHQIVADMHRARLLCPTYGPLCAIVGQWELFVLNDAIGADHVRLGYRLAPNNPDACFTAGLVAAAQSNVDETVTIFRRYLLLAPENMPQVADACIERFDRPDLAIDLAGQDPQRLLDVISILRDSPTKNESRTKSLAIAVARCKTAAVKDNVPANVFASIARLYRDDKQWPQAMANFRRAMQIDPGHVGLRLEVARLLAEMGQNNEAMEEARSCLRIQPGMDAALQLIAELSVAQRPSASQ